MLPGLSQMRRRPAAHGTLQCRLSMLSDSPSAAGAARPVVDKVFPFQSTNEALAYVETGRARGKVVIKVI